ncbi:tetratricopeptide repeat protein [Flavobacterium sp.]|uniref:tetratricopeptide repeat protein n=1 Tax=Flavobacterium sp. TaxID=239 RepID=UPI0032652C20
MNKTNQIGLLLLIAIITFFTYQNHFENAFHYDDSHTIVSNTNITSLKNIPTFFKDATTTSTSPVMQAYRPGLTTLNTIDYWLANDKMEPFYFHRTIFITFLFTGLLCFLFFKLILEQLVTNTKTSFWLAIFGAAWFLLHTTNAETINYIIARSDSFSTMTIVLAFVIYGYFPIKLKYYFYYLPIIIGFFVKEPVVIFLPLLWCYQLLFEQKKSIPEWFSFNEKTVKNILSKSFVPILLTALLVVVSRLLTPAHWVGGSKSGLDYVLTQPYVMLHYFQQFFLPVNLNIDYGWKEVKSFSDYRIWIGSLFLIVYGFFTFWSSKNKKLRGVTFGLLWFLIALLPTSLIPLAEVVNGHRTFFPYIGLFIAVISAVGYLLENYTIFNSKTVKYSFTVLAAVVLILNGFGTHARNKVWKTEESLWKDAMLKAPDNYRAKMNYALALFDDKKYDEAEYYFKEVILISPKYPNAYINLAAAYLQTKKLNLIPSLLDKAISLDTTIPEIYVQYAIYYGLMNNFAKAEELTDKGLSISPKHKMLNELKEEIQRQIATQPVNTNDSEALTAEDYLSLSVAYGKAGDYKKCIESCEKALKINPSYALPYANMSKAYIELKEWNKAKDAAQKGLAIDPTNEILKKNFEFASINSKK